MSVVATASRQRRTASLRTERDYQSPRTKGEDPALREEEMKQRARRRTRECDALD